MLDCKLIHIGYNHKLHHIHTNLRNTQLILYDYNLKLKDLFYNFEFEYKDFFNLNNIGIELD